MTPPVRLALRLIGPAVLLALVWATGLQRLGDVLGRGRAPDLAGAAGLNLAILAVKTWRWRRLMQLQAIQLGFAAAARHYAIGSALAAWTPGRLGDFSKAVAVRRERGVGLGRAVSSVIADRLLDAIALGLIAAVGSALLPGPRWICLAAAGLSGAMIAVWAAMGGSPGPAEWLRGRASGRSEAPMMRALAGMLGGMPGRALGVAGEETGAAMEGLRELTGRLLIVPAAATAAATALTFAQGLLVAQALDMRVDFWTLSVALAAVSITSLLPVSLAGLGTREATLAVFLGPGGTGLAEILGFSLAYLVTVSGSLALIGAVAWIVRPASKMTVEA